MRLQTEKLYCSIKGMKKFLQIMTLFFILALPTFATSYEEVLSNPQPTVVLFKMPGCPMCIQYEPHFDVTAQKHSDKYIFIKEDANSSQLASQIGVQKVPEVYIINPKTKNIYKAPDNVIFLPGLLGNILDKMN